MTAARSATIDLGDVVLVERTWRGGIQLSMALVRLPSGGVLVHSPLWVGEDTFAQVEAVGVPSVLFAPNHFHHLSLPRFRQKWPDAIAIASDGARPGLTKKGHAGLRPLADAQPLLPAGARFIACEATKNGEAWLVLPGERGPTFIVCDAFFNMRPIGGLMGPISRALKIAPGLCLGNTFRWVGIADEPRYRAWLVETLERERPARVIFSHGPPLVEDTTNELLELTRRRLRA